MVAFFCPPPFMRSASGLTSSFIDTRNSTADLTTYTFSSAPLGEAASGRYILLAITARAAASRTISSVMIGGQSAAIEAYQFFGTELTAFAIAAVPSGATGDIVVTFSAGAVNCSVAIYRLTGLQSTTPTDTELLTGSSTSPPTGNVDVVEGGAAFGIMIYTRSSNSWRTTSAHQGTLDEEAALSVTWTTTASSAAWTGLNKDSDFVQESAASSTNAMRASLISFG
jgi:hypothetical protein